MKHLLIFLMFVSLADAQVMRRRVTGFSPLSLPNLYLWLEGTNLSDLYREQTLTTNITADGDTIRGIKNKGLGNNAKAVDTSRVFYGASYGGVIANHWGTRSGVSIDTVIDSQTFTWFVMFFPPTSYAAYTAVLGFNKKEDACDGGGVFIKSNGKSAVYITNVANCATYNSYDGTGAATYGTDPLVPIIMEGVHVAGESLWVYKDGVFDQKCALGSTKYITGNIIVGSDFTTWNTPTNRTLKGAYKAVLIYRGALDSSQRALVRGYLTSLVADKARMFYYPSWISATTGALRTLWGWSSSKMFERNVTFSPSSSENGDYSVCESNGKFWMTYSQTRTWLSETPSIGLASSTNNGLTWTEIDSIDVSATGMYHHGGPEFVDVDDSVFIVFHGVSADGSVRKFFLITPTNAGWTTWSTPVEISWTAPPVKAIDAFLLKRATTYYLFYKMDDQPNDYIEYATASALRGNYTISQSGNWAGWGANLYEGTSMLYLTAWRVYFDKYTGSSGTFYSDSFDEWGTWSSPLQISPSGFRHGTMYRFKP